MDFCFSEDFLKVLEFSRDEAIRTGWHNISADHIMLGILRHGDNLACDSLEQLNLCREELKCSLDEALFVDECISWEERESVNFSDGARSMLEHAALEAARCRAACVGPLHYLLALCRMSGSWSHDWLEDKGISLRDLVEASGLPWAQYGLGQAKAETETAAPDPEALAAAIEKRLREGYGSGNPITS